MRLVESFPGQVLKCSKVLCASSYGPFIARKEFWSQCHILRLCNKYIWVIMDCGIAGLRFVDLMYFLASWGCGLAFFEKKTMLKFWQKSCPTYVGNPWKSFKHHRTSFQNQQKTVPNREKCVLGLFSAPNRAQVGSRNGKIRRLRHETSTSWPRVTL